MNQGITVNVLLVISWGISRPEATRLIGQIMMVAVLAFLVLGLSHAAKEEDTPLPLLGKIRILK